MKPHALTPRRAAFVPLAAGLLALLTACGGSGGDGSTAAGGAALQASQPGELVATVQEQLRRLSAQGRLSASVPVDVMVASPVAGAAPAGAGRSSTLVQEDGVDEPDLLQSRGDRLYALSRLDAGPVVDAHRRASDGRVSRVAGVSLALDSASYTRPDGMVLNTDGSALTVVSQQWTYSPVGEPCEVCLTLPMRASSHVAIHRVDVSDPAQPRAGERLRMDGQLVDSRRIGDLLVVVARHNPLLPVQTLPAGATPAQREAAIAALTATDLLPRLSRNGGAPQPLLADTDCWLQTANASDWVQLTTITLIDLKSPTLAATSRCFLGGSEAIYLSTANLYVATSRWRTASDTPGIAPMPAGMETDIHKFALSGGSVSYRASGSVQGHLGWDRDRMSYRLSEHAGDLRVLSYTGSLGWGRTVDPATAPSPAQLTVLRERTSDRTLQAVATLPNAKRPALLGKPGEQVYGVRFVGPRGYLVTFRRTDPLYVLDLGDPADPRVVGELEVTGVSDWLYPLPNGQLLGVGREADTSGRALGLKVALFDLRDPAKPTQRAAVTLGEAGSTSALDYTRHGLNLLQVGDVARVALPVMLADTGGHTMGLQQLDVDTAAGTISPRGLANATRTPRIWDLPDQRSLQIDGWVYHLVDGTVLGQAW